MAKKADSKARAASIFAAWKENPNGISKEAISYLRKYLKSDTEYAQELRDEYNFDVSLFTSGSVKNAKDSYNTYLFTPTPKRGKNGQDTASMIMRSGMRTNQTSPVSDVKMTKSEVGNRDDYMTATPAGGRTRTDGEVQAIIKRGRQGATLNLEDQRIYDRYMTMQREEAKAKQAAKAKEQADKQKAKERAEKFQYLGMEDDNSLSDFEVNELVERRKEGLKQYDKERISQKFAQENAEYEAKQKAIEAQAKAQAEADKAALARQQKETDNGRTPDMTDEDYAKWMQMGGTKFAKWGYSAEDEAEIENARREIKEAVLSGEMSAAEGAEAQRQIDEEVSNGRWKKQVTQKDNMPEGQPVISDDGQFYVSDGKWVPLTQRESAEDKRKTVLQDRKDKWIDSRAEKYLKETNFEDKPKYSYEEALALAQKDAVTRFGADEEKDYANYGMDWDTSEITPESVADTADGWVFGGNYEDDVAHGYTGTYEEWLAEYGGGEGGGGEEQLPPAQEQVQLPTQTQRHVKGSYL